jgi:hypothetical protein
MIMLSLVEPEKEKKNSKTLSFSAQLVLLYGISFVCYVTQLYKMNYASMTMMMYVLNFTVYLNQTNEIFYVHIFLLSLVYLYVFLPTFSLFFFFFFLSMRDINA